MILQVHIKNWEKYNPRRDAKACSWFRMSNDFLTDPALFDLNNDERMVLISLFCMASKTMSPLIKVNTALTAVLIRSTEKVVEAALDKLGRSHIVTSGNIEDLDPTNVTNVTNVTAEQEVPECSRASRLMEIWNEHRGSLASVARMTSKRRDKAYTRLREVSDEAYWVTVVQKLAASSFATGKNDRGWKASFDWLLENDTNHVKASEGKYDDKGGKKPEAKKALTMEELNALVS